jgi:hypothetical protein
LRLEVPSAELAITPGVKVEFTPSVEERNVNEVL